MGIHVRHQIRREVQARLVGLPGVASAVTTPLDSLDAVKHDEHLPCVVVDLPTETVSARKGDSETGVTLHRTLSLTVWLGAKPTSSSVAMDILEAMAVEVELRMLPEWNGRCFLLRSTDFDDERKRGALPFRAASLDYEITYTTREGEADSLAP